MSPRRLLAALQTRKVKPVPRSIPFAFGRRSLAALAAIGLIAATPPADLAPAAGPTPKAATPVAADAARPAMPTGAALTEADLGAWLDGMVPYALESGDIAGMVITVVKDGEVLLSRGYGLADVARKQPMDPDRSMVRIGSTSKLFTWTAVMQLVEQGKIDLDRDVNDYLDFRIEQPFGKKVTMRDLMNHRAGFEEGVKDLITFDPKTVQDDETYLKQHPRPMLFAPGTVPGYSNYGVTLAGYIVERVSGEPFDDYIERHIFAPLGMQHSTFAQPVPKRFEPYLAKGYATTKDAPSPIELITTRPAGSMATTANDMAKFMIAHLQQGEYRGQRILRAATVQQLQQPTQAVPPGFATMAHGFFHDTRNGRLVVGHGGDTIVFHTELDLLPQENVGIFYSFSSRGTDDHVYRTREMLIDGFLDRYFPAPPAPNLPTLASAKTDAARIAGRYQTSRRVDHGFLAFVYMMQQTVVTAHPDGTISMPSGVTGAEATFREVGPQLWQEVGDTHKVMLTEVDGVKTIIDSENPVSVLLQASTLRSAPVNLTILGFALFVLLATLLVWPIAVLVRRSYGVAREDAAIVRPKRWQRGAAAVGVVWLAAWVAFLQPLLTANYGFYATANDPLVTVMQLSGFLVIAATLAAGWACAKLWRSGASRKARIWSVLVVLALAGLVWLGLIGQLIGLNLNY